MTSYNSRYAYKAEHPEQGGWRTYYRGPRATNTREGGAPAWIMFGPRHDKESQARVYLKYIDEMQPREPDAK